MQYKGEAIYHDGICAKANELELSFDIETGELYFEHDNLKKSWAPYSYHFEKRGATLILFNARDYSNFEISDPAFAVPFLQRFDGIAQASFYTRLIRAGFAAHVGLALITLGIIYFMSQHAIPFASEKAVYLIPPSFDDKIGETYYNEFIQFNYVDENKTKLVQKFVDKMELDNKKKIKITVVNSYEVNAFALPSGHVVVYTGILDQMERYEELAALVSHEVSHINKRHSMRALLRELSGQLFFSAILGDVSRFTDILMSNANELKGLSYSRNLETEADREGMKLMRKNKINIVGFQLLFERLSAVTKGAEPPEFLNTHPLSSDRIKAAKKNMYRGEINHELRRIFEEIGMSSEETEDEFSESLKEIQEILENN
jgi:beta-barrel assembly-enhancing protease